MIIHYFQCKDGSEVNLKVGGDISYDAREENKSNNVLLIAGGVGINPLFSMFQSNFHFLSDEKRGEGGSTAIGKTMLLYSAPSKDELIFKVSQFTLTFFSCQSYFFWCITR